MDSNTSQCGHNVFVLTTGLSGSSLVTGLIARAGYWAGDRTEFKDNSTGQYETYENSRFVELNNRLIELSGKTFDSFSWYDANLRSVFAKQYQKVDLAEYKAFARQCSEHQPWVLKDPKLWVTLDFWLQVFADQHPRCVIVSRDIRRLWLSQTLKRIVYDYQFLKDSEHESRETLQKLLDKQRVAHVSLVYENLLQDPELGIEKLNEFLNSNLTETDWGEVYQADNVSTNSAAKWLKAVLIYLKNYPGRVGA